ncbi:LytTR family DNA-binding domain-containing protein [Sediminicoccus sp. KRV36]|uniref:LytR/AlgR family response regulator transcription factor n=1 Tax=Sediminicoccus sp. KRV36 TaxID=3133721 RepID=UPI00200E635D|nr:LytTR family DNA-binding domain-containing protein [Sediminicoccus rosea]UPY36286.1 LytTR family DNA-binding domain-containing protein [Sediminicoccus rosea]
MLRVVIVDDEPLAIRSMQRLLAAHADVSIVGTADSLGTAVETIRATRPDLVFLDIELGGGNGFDVLAQLDPQPRIVFVTAHARHAVDAFAVAATDYLLKPVLPERLAESLARVIPGGPSRRALTLRTPGRTVIAEAADIAAFCAEGDFTRIHLAGQPSLLILRTLGQFEATLPQPPFKRIGRSLILNLERVRHVASRGRDQNEVVIEGLERPLPLGRVATLRLRAALEAVSRSP